MHARHILAWRGTNVYGDLVNLLAFMNWVHVLLHNNFSLLITDSKVELQKSLKWSYIYLCLASQHYLIYFVRWVHWCQVWRISAAQLFKDSQVWDFDALDFNNFFIMKSMKVQASTSIYLHIGWYSYTLTHILAFKIHFVFASLGIIHWYIYSSQYIHITYLDTPVQAYIYMLIQSVIDTYIKLSRYI